MSPWIAALIIGREFVIMGLRGVIASDGAVMAPSSLGKLKTSIQFVAIALAIWRPGDPIGDLYLDEYAMLIAAVITVWSAVDYLVRAAPQLRGGSDPDLIFLTGGSGFVGEALAKRLVADGEEVVGLARSGEAAGKLEALGVRAVRGDVLDEDAMAAGMAGCALAYHVAGINTMCPTDPAAMFHVNVRGAELAVRAAARAGVKRVVLTSSAATLGEEHGTVGNEDSPHRGWFMSVYEQTKHDGEVAAFAAAQAEGIELVAVTRPPCRARGGRAARAGSCSRT